jgi:hypothetical protein
MATWLGGTHDSDARTKLDNGALADDGNAPRFVVNRSLANYSYSPRPVGNKSREHTNAPRLVVSGEPASYIRAQRFAVVGKLTTEGSARHEYPQIQEFDHQGAARTAAAAGPNATAI